MITGVSGFTLTLFAMIVACIPPAGTPNVLVFELKVLGGALAFVLAGVVFYVRGSRRGAGRDAPDRRGNAGAA
jgi:hypothetical protein